MTDAELWEKAIQDVQAELAAAEVRLTETKRRMARLRMALQVFRSNRTNSIPWPRDENDSHLSVMLKGTT